MLASQGSLVKRIGRYTHREPGAGMVTDSEGPSWYLDSPLPDGSWAASLPAWPLGCHSHPAWCTFGHGLVPSSPALRHCCAWRRPGLAIRQAGWPWTSSDSLRTLSCLALRAQSVAGLSGWEWLLFPPSLLLADPARETEPAQMLQVCPFDG